MSLDKHGFVSSLEETYLAHQNLLRAPEMAAYMKNQFSFFGIDSSTRKTLQKPWISTFKTIESFQERWRIIQQLLNREQREFHYTAVDCINSLHKKYYSQKDAHKIQQMLLTHTWWDTVDAIATNYLGAWANLFPQEATDLFQKWQKQDNFWLHRCCLIFQLKYKQNTDIQLLEYFIVQFQSNKEFFIQKAIGWALREVSKHNPKEVERIILNHSLQGLAKREASKYL